MAAGQISTAAVCKVNMLGISSPKIDFYDFVTKYLLDYKT